MYIIYAVFGGSNTYAAMQSFAGLWPIKVVYWGFVYALFFHLCHGVRHLIWDIGKSFDRDTLNRYAMIELGASLVLTLTVLLFI